MRQGPLKSHFECSERSSQSLSGSRCFDGHQMSLGGIFDGPQNALVSCASGGLQTMLLQESHMCFRSWCQGFRMGQDSLKSYNLDIGVRSLLEVARNRICFPLVPDDVLAWLLDFRLSPDCSSIDTVGQALCLHPSLKNRENRARAKRARRF